jgi:TRAP-type mannitol/chloroaromatic compound transport system permease small subunit
VTSEPRPSPPQEQREAPQGGASRISVFGQLTQVLNIAGTVLILAMAIAVNADVIGRDLFNHPIPGVLEFMGLSIVAIVFLQMANTLREDRHVSNDLVMRLVAHKHPRTAATFYGLFNLIGAVLMVLIVIYVWPLLMLNYRGGYYAGTAGVVEIPIWPFMSTVVIGSCATAVQFLILAWDQFSRAYASRAT